MRVLVSPASEGDIGASEEKGAFGVALALGLVSACMRSNKPHAVSSAS